MKLRKQTFIQVTSKEVFVSGGVRYGVVDVGTTGVKLAVYDEGLSRVYYERLSVGFEKTAAGYVEQDAAKLAEVVKGFARKAKSMGARKLGICTYRASVVAWSKEGLPLTNVVTWIDGRGKDVVERLPSYVKVLKRVSGAFAQILSPDSPAVLMRWIFDHVEGLREKVERGEAYLWTVDSYILYTLTRGFRSDATNAALTGLIHPKNLEEIDIVFSLLKLPRRTPEVVDNVVEAGSFEGLDVSVLIADQQAASVAAGALREGVIESVHGTGSFVEQCTGRLAMVGGGLVPLIILSLDGRRVYGVEGFIRTTGSIVEWLREVGFFSSYEEMEELAARAGRGALIVPAYGGFRCPRAPDVRGLVCGLSLGVRRGEVVAGLAWGVALHLAYIVREIWRRVGASREPLWASGGYSRSDFFLQALADATGLRVARPVDVESSCRGVAKLLALADGRISRRELEEPPPTGKVFEPRVDAGEREHLIEKYRELLGVLRRWEKNPFLSGTF